MKWSWKLLRVAGIDIFVHATFLLLLLWVGVSYWNIGHSWQAVVSGVGFIIALFVCVVLHEFGHALTARRFGIGTKNITLLPIGGVALLDKLPEDPRQEIIVALAGPAVNIVIVLILLGWFQISGSPFVFEQIDLERGFSLQALLLVNISLAAFNLLPIFPMDGGRVFRASLALKMNRNEATQVAAKTGQVFALFLGLLGLLTNPFLIIIALFLWMGASSESSMEHLKARLSGMNSKHAMITEFHTLTPSDPLSRAMQFSMISNQTAFPIIENNQLVGILPQSDLIRGLHNENENAPVGNYVQSDVCITGIKDPLEKALDLLLKHKSALIAVTDSDRLVGIIDLQNIMEFVSFQSAIKR